MATKQRSGVEAEDAAGEAPAELVWLDPAALAANEANTNIRSDLGDLGELVESIRAVGVLQALTVTPDGDGHRLLAGAQRTATAIEAGLARVPCLVRPDLTDVAARVASQIVENDRRQDISAAAASRSPVGARCEGQGLSRRGRRRLRSKGMVTGRRLLELLWRQDLLADRTAHRAS